MLGPDGRLQLIPDAQGNVVPDFSDCGYGGGEPLPEVPVVVTLEPVPGDNTAHIQQALDKVAALPPENAGFRGAVLLKSGTYKVAGTVVLRTSGVVLRGEGSGANGTVLRAVGRFRRPLLRIQGAGSPRVRDETLVRIVDDYVPVGTRRFEVESPSGYAVGDTVHVRRHGNAAWIAAIGMDGIAPRKDGRSVPQWRPFSIAFDRIITGIEGSRITVDAPLVCALERRWGGGVLVKYEDSSRIADVGIEHIRLVSDFDGTVTAMRGKETYPADEDHAWEGVLIDRAINAWVRDLVALHFGFGCVRVLDAKWVTVQDCDCLDMVSRIDGGRRYSFYLEGGQLCLVKNCTARGGRHDFAFGARAWGPNVFLDCHASETFDFSEPHYRWSVGGLYDNVSAPIAVQDRWNWGPGHGWGGANYVLWNCEGPVIAQTPPFAFTWVVGHVGPRREPYQERAPATLVSFGTHVLPRSLYLQQVAERRGPSTAPSP